MRRPVLLVVILILVACTPGRPDVSAWLPRWQAATQAMPPPPPPGSALDRATCDRTVASLRQVRDGLLPTPDDQLDITVDAWIRFAEDLFFECPIAGGPHAGWERGYAELERLESEVLAFLSAG